MTSSLAQGVCGSSAERHAAMFPLSGRQNKGTSGLHIPAAPSAPPPERVFQDSVGGGSNFQTPTADVAARLAKMWSSNPAVKMLLPSVVASADADGDGTIDRGEFNQLLAAAGGGGADASRLFAEADADGDGELSMAELQGLGDKTTKQS